MTAQGLVPERPISFNPELKFCFVFALYIPMHCLGYHFLLSLLYLVVNLKAQQHFVTSSCMFLDKKTMLEIWLNPGLNLTIFQGTRPRKFYFWNYFPSNSQGNPQAPIHPLVMVLG